MSWRAISGLLQVGDGGALSTRAAPFRTTLGARRGGVGCEQGSGTHDGRVCEQGNGRANVGCPTIRAKLGFDLSALARGLGLPSCEARAGGVTRVSALIVPLL